MKCRSYRKCEICGYKSERKNGERRYFMARFPRNDEARCKLWVKMTGNEDLAYVPIEKLYQNKFICGLHFDDQDFNKKKTQLKNTAVPSLMLTAQPLSDEILSGFPYHLFSNSLSLNEDCTSKEDKLPVIEKKTTFVLRHGYAKKELEPEHNYCKPPQSEITQFIENFAATDIRRRTDEDQSHTSESKISHTNFEQVYLMELDTTVSESMVPENMVDDDDDMVTETLESESKLPKPTKRGSVLSTTNKNLTKRRFLTKKLSPESKMFYEKYKKTRTKLNNAMARLKAKKKIDKVQFLDKALTGMNDVAKHILLMQVRLFKKKNRGRRFSVEDKALGLMILNQKPELYKFLRGLFILPSERLLKSMCAGHAHGELGTDLPNNNGEVGEDLSETDEEIVIPENYEDFGIDT